MATGVGKVQSNFFFKRVMTLGVKDISDDIVCHASEDHMFVSREGGCKPGWFPPG